MYYVAKKKSVFKFELRTKLRTVVNIVPTVYKVENI